MTATSGGGISVLLAVVLADTRCLPEAEPEGLVAPEEVKRLVLCSGKVYYDLARARSLNSIDDVAIARVEELAPFPYGSLRRNVFVWLFSAPSALLALLISWLCWLLLCISRKPSVAHSLALSWLLLCITADWTSLLGA